MGQGHYTMIALGTTNVPERPDSISADDWEGWRYSVEGMPDRLRSQYEAPPYLAIPLAISDGVLQDWWKVPMELGNPIIDMTDLSVLDEAGEEAIKLWRQAQRLVAAHGRKLPDPTLLLIADYH